MEVVAPCKPPPVYSAIGGDSVKGASQLAAGVSDLNMRASIEQKRLSKLREAVASCEQLGRSWGHSRWLRARKIRTMSIQTEPSRFFMPA